MKLRLHRTRRIRIADRLAPYRMAPDLPVPTTSATAGAAILRQRAEPVPPADVATSYRVRAASR